MDTGFKQLSEQELNTVSPTKLTEYGTIGATVDGRLYRYVGFGYVSGVTTFAPGLGFYTQVAPANSTGLAITGTGTGGQVAGNLSAGATTIVLTNGSTAVWQDEFAYLQLNISAGGTYNLKLIGHSAAAASTGYITCYLSEPLPPAITTLIPGTDVANLIVNPWAWVLPTKTESKAIGVSVAPATATTAAKSTTNTTPGSFGWLQTRGLSYVAATSGTLGYPMGQDVTTTAGFFINKGSGTTTEELGTFVTAAASAGATAFLRID